MPKRGTRLLKNILMANAPFAFTLNIETKPKKFKK